MSDLFYLQDSRGYVGNDMLFWGLGSSGYVTDLRKAQLYTFEEAQSLHLARSTDIPWPKEYIEARTRPAVDMQYCKLDEAKKLSKIKFVSPKKIRRKPVNCCGCGKFITNEYCNCPHCGASNWP